MNSKEEILANHIQGLEAAVGFFNSGNHAVAERMSVHQFLSSINLPHDKSEIVSPTDDPPDVDFRDAHFEVKEILDEGRERHREYKEALERARQATSVNELHEQFYPKTLRLSEIVSRYEAAVASLERKYPPAVRADLDLLFYVNLVEHMFFEADHADLTLIKSAGWRSVSFVNGRYGSCLHASLRAPSFLLAAQGHVSEHVA